MSLDLKEIIDDYIAILEETNHFEDEDGFGYRLHDKTHFKVEVYTVDDLDPYGRVHHWGGLEPTYFDTYHQALACWSKWILEHAEYRMDIQLAKEGK